ncbi:hypothetical protein CHLNCDRAFT_7735, partial [Chlorella variabilis]
DTPLAAAPTQVAAAFAALELPGEPEKHREALQTFCRRWLLPVESDLQPAEVPQLAAGPPPAWLPLVAQPDIRRWAESLFHMWGSLCRQVAPDVAAHPDRHTLLLPPQPRPFVIPGARFREQYYWDTFWSVRGLLACGLLEMAQASLGSLAGLRGCHRGPAPASSPTLMHLLPQMVAALHAAAPDEALLLRALAAFRQEHNYWMSGAKEVALRGADGRTYRLARYHAAWDKPRPESYRQGWLAAGLPSRHAPACLLWRELATAAESGWDFSSRWLADGTSLRSCRATRVVPADLNALLYQMESNMAAFADEVGYHGLAAGLVYQAKQRLAAIRALMWDDASGQWRDLVLGAPDGADEASTDASAHPVLAASNWVPLYCGCAAAGSAQAAAAVASLRGSGLIREAGVAVSLRETGQQWDWPNAWPPITCMLVEGCQKYGGEAGAQLAAAMAQQYLETAHAGWEQSGRNFEKFDARRLGAPGGGGEYDCVDGFGWTNGVALALLQQYGW